MDNSPAELVIEPCQDDCAGEQAEEQAWQQMRMCVALCLQRTRGTATVHEIAYDSTKYIVNGCRMSHVVLIIRPLDRVLLP